MVKVSYFLLGTNAALNSQSFLPSAAAHLCSTVRAIRVWGKGRVNLVENF